MEAHKVWKKAAQTLWDDEPAKLARTAHPVTSHEAAENLVRAGAISRMCEVALQLLCDHPGMTANELDALYASKHNRQIDGTIRKRLNDLRRRGLAAPGIIRRCNVTGKNARVWWAWEEKA